MPKNQSIQTVIINGKPITTSIEVGIKATKQFVAKALGREAIEITKKSFGHTFTNHGEDMTNLLVKRAEGAGMAQGQFLDNQVAARFIKGNLDKVKNGAVSLPMPKGFPARMIKPDGTFGVPTKIRLVPSGNGVKTAYPEF